VGLISGSGIIALLNQKNGDVKAVSGLQGCGGIFVRRITIRRNVGDRKYQKVGYFYYKEKRGSGQGISTR